MFDNHDAKISKQKRCSVHKSIFLQNPTARILSTGSIENSISEIDGHDGDSDKTIKQLQVLTFKNIVHVKYILVMLQIVVIVLL